MYNRYTTYSKTKKNQKENHVCKPDMLHFRIVRVNKKRAVCVNVHRYGSDAFTEVAHTHLELQQTLPKMQILAKKTAKEGV